MNKKNLELRSQIMNEWFDRGADAYQNKNDFEAFIYLWISLVVGCKVYFGANITIDKHAQKNTTDLEVIKYWFRNNSTVVKQILDNNSNTLSILGTRKGTYFGNPIIDASKNLQIVFGRLKGYFSGIYNYDSDKKVSEDFSELLNKIRNNLFHGDKSYDNKQDRALLQAVLPSLYSLTKQVVDENQI